MHIHLDNPMNYRYFSTLQKQNMSQLRLIIVKNVIRNCQIRKWLHTSILNTTISPARIGAFPMYRNKMSPWIHNYLFFLQISTFRFILTFIWWIFQTILFETQVPCCLREPPPPVTHYQCSISDLSTL